MGKIGGGLDGQSFRHQPHGGRVAGKAHIVKLSRGELKKLHEALAASGEGMHIELHAPPAGEGGAFPFLALAPLAAALVGPLLSRPLQQIGHKFSKAVGLEGKGMVRLAGAGKRKAKKKGGLVSLAGAR